MMTATLTHGRSLSRPLPSDAIEAHHDRIDNRKVVGIAHISVVRSHVPGQQIVELLNDGLSLEMTMAALRVAEQRLAAIHGDRPTEPVLSISELTASQSRQIAEQLVDAFRDCHFDGPVFFARSRENCVGLLSKVIAGIAIGTEAGL